MEQFRADNTNIGRKPPPRRWPTETKRWPTGGRSANSTTGARDFFWSACDCLVYYQTHVIPLVNGWTNDSQEISERVRCFVKLIADVATEGAQPA